MEKFPLALGSSKSLFILSNWLCSMGVAKGTFPFLLWLLGNSSAAVFFTVGIFLLFLSLSPDFLILFASSYVTAISVTSLPCGNKIKCRKINGSEAPPVFIGAESSAKGRAVTGPPGHGGH